VLFTKNYHDLDLTVQTVSLNTYGTLFLNTVNILWKSER